VPPELLPIAPAGCRGVERRRSAQPQVAAEAASHGATSPARRQTTLTTSPPERRQRHRCRFIEAAAEIPAFPPAGQFAAEAPPGPVPPPAAGAQTPSQDWPGRLWRSLQPNGRLMVSEGTRSPGGRPSRNWPYCGDQGLVRRALIAQRASGRSVPHPQQGIDRKSPGASRQATGTPGWQFKPEHHRRPSSTRGLASNAAGWR